MQLPGPRFRLKNLLAKSVNDLFVLLEIHRALGKQSSHKNLGFPNGNQRFSSISLAMFFFGWNRKSEFVFWSKEESRHYNNQKKCVLLSHQIGVVFLLAYICVWFVLIHFYQNRSSMDRKHFWKYLSAIVFGITVHQIHTIVAKSISGIQTFTFLPYAAIHGFHQKIT